MSDKLIKPKIVFLLGYPRSGSTVFGELINQLHEFVHIGEMERLWHPRKDNQSNYPDKRCSCGKDLAICEFWESHFKNNTLLLKEISKRENRGIYFYTIGKIKQKFIKKGDFQSKEVKIFTEVVTSFYNTLFQKESKIILDSSKELWFAQYLESTGNFDISYIHLIRNVNGIVYSRQKKIKTVNNTTGNVSLNYKYLIYDTLRWNYTNSKIRAFLKNKNFIQVLYEDLMINPKQILVELGSMMNLRLNPDSAIDTENKFVISENHLLHGNRFRFKRGTIELKKDNRWAEQMKKRDKKLIKSICWFKS